MIFYVHTIKDLSSRSDPVLDIESPMSLDEVRPIPIGSKRYPSCELELHNTYNGYFIKRIYFGRRQI